MLAFVDVDGLKAMNDLRGHAAGDDLLHGVAACIRQALRPYDVIVRYGGDEFVCSLSGQGIAGVIQRFDQIAAHLADTVNGATISVGFAEQEPGEPLEDLIVRADRAMLATRDRV